MNETFVKENRWVFFGGGYRSKNQSYTFIVRRITVVSKNTGMLVGFCVHDGLEKRACLATRNDLSYDYYDYGREGEGEREKRDVLIGEAKNEKQKRKLDCVGIAAKWSSDVLIRLAKQKQRRKLDCVGIAAEWSGDVLIR